MINICMLIENIIHPHIQEGPNDPAIFKAIFLAGGPGSGKSFIVDRTALSALGFKVVNNDVAFERNLSRAGLSPTPDNIYSPQGQELRTKAKEITNKQMKGYLDGTLGLVIDGTGKDYDKIAQQAQKLKDLGYDTAMIFVNTDLDTALARNQMRARQLPDNEVSKMWIDVQKNLGKFQHFFRNDMHIIDNSMDTDANAQVTKLYTRLQKWSKQIGTRRITK